MTALDIALQVVAKEVGLQPEIVGKVYKAYWLSIKRHIQALPLKQSLTSEDFSKLQTSFNIPSLGKLHSTYEYVEGVKRRFNYLQKIRKNAENKETQADV